jgi:hypothetical protein
MAVASSAVSRDAAVAADTKFTIADQASVIREQIADGFGLIVPSDGNAMFPDVHRRARIVVGGPSLTLLCSTDCAHNVRRDLGSNHWKLLRLGTSTQEQNDEPTEQPNRMRMDSQSGASLSILLGFLA